MSDLIRGGYFVWLCDHVITSKASHPRYTYWSLLHQLHETPFRWFVHNDDNRVEDGKDLRTRYQNEFDMIELDEPDTDASMLEVLIALSEGAAYNSVGRPSRWFWKLLENLGLSHYTDAHYNDHVIDEVAEVLQKVVSRDYGEDGRGGLFPLQYPDRDQRRVEIWYQLAAYLHESTTYGTWPYLR